MARLPFIKISKYFIVCGETRFELMELVNEYLKEGYVPLGSPFKDDWSYTQALILWENENV